MMMLADKIGSACRLLFLGMVCCLVSAQLSAQEPVGKYTVKDGKMYIELSKNIKEASLDSFVNQFALGELALKDFILQNIHDSLMKHGWKVEKNTRDLFVISKPLLGFDKILDPAEKILFTDKHLKSGELFPEPKMMQPFGINQFRRKQPFAVKDSLVTFYWRNNKNASQVILSGSFNQWSTDAMPMEKTDSGWIRTVALPPGKHWYKFIVDGNWTVDTDNSQKENDGLGNINSVYYKTNYVIRLDSFVSARKVMLAGSFNGWNDRDIAMQRTATGWSVPLYLEEGTHTYRFVVDGRWMADPFNPDKWPNEFGEFNSVIRVGDPYLFRLEGYQEASQVLLTGSFNGWNEHELRMQKVSGGWEIAFPLRPGNYEYQFLVDGRRMGRDGGNGNLIFIIEPNYTFRLRQFPDAKSVYIAGDSNGWSPNGFPMEKQDDEWVLRMHLSPGKHIYKFVVDGKWILDPDNKLWEQNEFDTGNSVIWIELGGKL